MINILERLGLKKPTIQEKNPQTVPIVKIINKNIFYCHYCQKGFEVQPTDIFPMGVQSVGKDYMFAGQGVKCPHCKMDCIYN